MCVRVRLQLSGAAVSPPPPLIAEADDELDENGAPWHFVIVDGVRQRVDEKGNPVITVQHGRRAAAAAGGERGDNMSR